MIYALATDHDMDVRDLLLNWHRRIFTEVRSGDTRLNIVNAAAGEVSQGVALQQQCVNRFHVPHMLAIWSRMVVV